MQGANKGSAPALNGQGLRVGVVQARFNEGITNALYAACADELQQLGVTDITHVQVPGALEVPVAMNAMAASGRFDALVALGCVIRGETYHFELVCNESAAGVTRVALDHRVAVANAILTTENLSQALARQDSKARDAAQVAIEMAHVLKRFSA
jgi:6,7-dimethyl-8-ribityllumazine synthase